MKQMIKQQLGSFANTKNLITISLLGTLSAFIWYAGPAITVSNFVPFEEPEKRFYMIAVLFLAWILKANFLDTKKNPITPVKPALHSPELAKKLENIDGRFQGAIRFLKKTFINKNGKDVNLYHLPWYLFVGPANSGKTSLLANANINFILAKQFKNENLQNIPPSEVCDWWATRDMVVLDVPSNYLYSRQKNAANVAQPKTAYALWRSFLSLVKKYRGTKALSGIILALPLPELMAQKQTKERSFAELKQRMVELRAQFGENLPFHFVITKCDLLPGFTDFFSECGSDELLQTWGVALTTKKEHETLQEAFTSRFNALIKRLNKQLLWRLHQERNPLTRPQIKDFPLHVERLKENILNVIKMLTSSESQFRLQGVYLTSAIQQTSEAQQTMHLHAAGNLSSHAVQIMRNPAMPSKTYFIKQLLLQSILATGDRTPVRTSFNWKRRPLLFTAYVATAILICGVLANELRHSIKQTYAIKESLAKYQSEIQQGGQTTPHLVKALSLLNALQQTATSNTVLPYTDKAEQSADIAYQQALKTIVLPEIKGSLENYLLNATNDTPEELYIALKAYLMLGDSHHMQPEFVLSAMHEIMPTLFNQDNSSDLNKHIQAALTSARQTMELNDDAIAHARRQLNSLSPLALSFAIVKCVPANRLSNTISLKINTTDLATADNKDVTDEIPTMYTAESFQDIYNRQIAAAVHEVLNGNWVLAPVHSATTPTAAVLTEQLRTLYVTSYVNTWENVLANARLLSPTNLAEADAQYQSLAHNDSPMSQLLQAVKDNTSFPAILSASTKLATLGSLTSNDTSKNASLTKTFAAINQIHAGLQTLVNTQDPKDAAFKVAFAHMKNPTATDDFINLLFTTANNSPAPLKFWLTSLAAKSWHFILQDAASHIEKYWQKDIMTTYNEELANRFPFASNATKEVGLAQFTHFLGTRGAITAFYQTYLQPFITTSNKGWAWKRVNNDQIPFSNSVLIELQHAAQLQHTFFPKGDNQLSIKFTLQPFALEHNMKKILVNMNGQSIQYIHAAKVVPQALNWPGNKRIHSSSLNLQVANSAPLTSHVSVEWGWFRLINKSTQKVVSPQELLVNFQVNGHQAKYLLLTEGHFNPFLPVNLQNFRLPQQLMNA